MFTGLVQAVGRIELGVPGADGMRLTVSSPLAAELRQGDSVSVNGVCLTAVGVEDGAFTTELMNETLSRSSLASAAAGTPVNLELPMRPLDRLGGHIVQGHVDALGAVVSVAEDGFARRLTIEAPRELLAYVVEKGSIAVDGVSLTVAELSDRCFTVSLIPETLSRTNLGAAEPGTRVNLEADVLAKYVEKLLRRDGAELP